MTEATSLRCAPTTREPAPPPGEGHEAVEQPAHPPASECVPAAAGVAADPRLALAAALCDALRAVGPLRCPARQALVAGLALRLAPLGYVTEVRFSVAEGTPFDAIRSVLAEVTAPAAPEADPRLSAQEPAGGAISPEDKSQAAPDPAHALGSVREAYVKRSRGCLECGRGFEVNFRHADAHRFCSAVCRSRHHHAEAKATRPASTGLLRS